MFFKTFRKPVPEGSSLPTWPAADANRSPYMMLDKELKLGGAVLENRTRFWDDIYEKYYLEAIPPRSGADSMASKDMFNLLMLYVLCYFTKKITVE